MSSSSPINSMVAKAKSTLAHANNAFPSPKASPSPVKVSAPVTPKPQSNPEGNIGAELADKAKNVKQYEGAPKMHKGGPITADGVYALKAGEHVLAPGEADKARKHAIMASGMKSLMRPGKKVSKSAKMIDSPKGKI